MFIEGQVLIVSSLIQLGVTGLEPATSCSQSRRSSQTELHPGAVGTVASSYYPVSLVQKPFYTNRAGVPI